MRAVRTRALSTLCLIAVYLAATFYGTAHEAFERHKVCADHGELVHVPDADHDHSADEGSHGSEAPVFAQTESDDAEHEHCPFVLGLRQDETRAVAAVLKAPSPAARPASPLQSPRAGNVPLFRLAPKQSPPA